LRQDPGLKAEACGVHALPFRAGLAHFASHRKTPNSLDELLDRLLQFVQLGKNLGLPLGIDLLPVDGDLEGAAFAGYQRDAACPLTKGLQQLLRRPRGACGVVSRTAVEQFDFQLFVGHRHTS
jgi:hypothetical protein